MTIGLVSVGDATDLMDASFSGFNYPNNVSVTPLVSDGTNAGNAVLQQGGLGYRQAELSVLAEDVDMGLLRTYYEARTAVTFIDFDGSSSTVVVLAFSRSMRMTGLWDVSMTLIETVAPVVGS